MVAEFNFIDVWFKEQNKFRGKVVKVFQKCQRTFFKECKKCCSLFKSTISHKNLGWVVKNHKQKDKKCKKSVNLH